MQATFYHIGLDSARLASIIFEGFANVRTPPRKVEASGVLCHDGCLFHPLEGIRNCSLTQDDRRVPVGVHFKCNGQSG